MSTDPTIQDTLKQATQRIDRAEEAAGYADHRAEQLGALVAELSTQIYELNLRIGRFEKRLADLQTNQQDVPNEPPPHSHRPL